MWVGLILKVVILEIIVSAHTKVENGRDHSLLSESRNAEHDSEAEAGLPASRTCLTPSDIKLSKNFGQPRYSRSGGRGCGN